MSERPKVWKGESWTGDPSGRWRVSDPVAPEEVQGARPCIVQDLPEGCPEHFPLPEEMVTYYGYGECEVIGRPHDFTESGRGWRVPLMRSSGGVVWAGVTDPSLNWPGKPKPESQKQILRLTFKVSKDANVQRASEGIKRLADALSAAHVAFGGNGLVLDRVEEV